MVTVLQEDWQAEPKDMSNNSTHTQEQCRASIPNSDLDERMPMQLTEQFSNTEPEELPTQNPSTISPSEAQESNNNSPTTPHLCQTETNIIDNEPIIDNIESSFTFQHHEFLSEDNVPLTSSSFESMPGPDSEELINGSTEQANSETNTVISEDIKFLGTDDGTQFVNEVEDSDPSPPSPPFSASPMTIQRTVKDVDITIVSEDPSHLFWVPAEYHPELSAGAFTDWLSRNRMQLGQTALSRVKRRKSFRETSSVISAGDEGDVVVSPIDNNLQPIAEQEKEASESVIASVADSVAPIPEATIELLKESLPDEFVPTVLPKITPGTKLKRAARIVKHRRGSLGKGSHQRQSSLTDSASVTSSMDDLDEIDKNSESKLSNHGDPILENKKLSDFADEARNDSSPIFVVKESAIDTSILSSNISTEIVAPSSSVAIATPQPSLPEAPTLHPPRTVSRHKRPTHSTIAESKSAVSNTESAVSSATSMAALDLSTSTHSSTGNQLISQFGDDTSFPITSVKIIPPKRSTSLKKPSLDKRKDDKLPECETNAILQNSPSVNDGDDTKSDSASSVTPESPVLDAQFMTPTSSVISTLIPLPPSLQSRSAPKTALPSEDESSSSSPQSLPSSPANLSTSPSKSIIRSIFGFSLSTSNPPSSLPSSNGSAPISQSLPNISQPFPTATDSQTDPPIEFRVKRSESLPIISEKKKVVSNAQQRRKSSEVLGALNLETGSDGVESKVEPEKENAEPTGEPNELHSRQRKGSWSSWFRTNVAREKEKEKGLGDNNEESTTADSPVSLPVASTAPSNMPAATIDPVVKPKKSGLSSLFKASKKALQSSLSSSNQTKSSTKEASLDVTSVKYSSPLRYPLHIERAICRLAHQKLANPKRPLCHQVLISNMLVWYVGLRKREQEMMLANSIQAPNEAMQGDAVNSTVNGRNSDTSPQENGTNRNDVVVWKKGKLSAVDGSGKPRKKKKKRMNNGGRVEFVLPPVNYNNRNSVGEHVSPVTSVDFASQPKKRRKTKPGGKSRPRSKSVEASPGKDKSSGKVGDGFDAAANTWRTDGADVSITMDQSGLSYQPSRVKIKKVSSGNGSSTHEHNVATVEASGYAQPQSAIIEDESSLQFSSYGLAATDENATGHPGGSDTSSASGSDVEMEDYFSDDTDGSGLSDASVDEDDDEVPLGLVFNRKKGGGSAVTSHTP